MSAEGAGRRVTSVSDDAMLRRLLVGTNNPNKAREIGELLAGAEIEIVAPLDLGIDDEPEENGATFEENALIKARFYSARTGLPGLADDSGLAVDALGGRPGVFSSRYAPTDSERIARLLGELEGVAPEVRTARFVCAAALVVPGGAELPLVGEPRGPGMADGAREIVEVGTCEGRIALEPRGENGFGYDPVFYLPDADKTMAELSPEAKNARSHRGRALRAIQRHFVSR